MNYDHESSDFRTASGAKRDERTSCFILRSDGTEVNKERGQDKCASDLTPDRRQTDLESESAYADVLLT